MGVIRLRGIPGYHRQQVISRIDHRPTLLRSAVNTAISKVGKAPIVHRGNSLATAEDTALKRQPAERAFRR